MDEWGHDAIYRKIAENTNIFKLFCLFAQKC